MGYGIFGYVEVRDMDERDWHVYNELETGDIGRGGPVHLVFGYGSRSASGASLFKDRGLPSDMSDEVREDYEERQWVEHPQMDRGGYRSMFGHSYVTASELPRFVTERLGPLAEAADEYGEARLCIWFNR